VTIIVADTCSLVNFAAVNRMDIVEATLRRRAYWTQAVEYEVNCLTHRYAPLKAMVQGGWLGEAIELSTAEDYAEISRIRTALGGTGNNALEHLGEAESIRAMQSRVNLRGAVLLTDDGSASDFARRRNLIVWDTCRLLEDAHAMGEVGCPEAFELLKKMRSAHRNVRIPTDHHGVC
jgi:hypothetical protein